MVTVLASGTGKFYVFVSLEGEISFGVLTSMPGVACYMLVVPILVSFPHSLPALASCWMAFWSRTWIGALVGLI